MTDVKFSLFMPGNEFCTVVCHAMEQGGFSVAL